jgi:dihydrodipicolinate reductase
MVATGEYIRMTNYVDDIAATLRRIVVGTTTMTDDEKKRLAEYMRKVEPNYAIVVQQLEGAK